MKSQLGCIGSGLTAPCIQHRFSRGTFLLPPTIGSYPISSCIPASEVGTDLGKGRVKCPALCTPINTACVCVRLGLLLEGQAMAGERFLQVNKSMVCLSRLRGAGQGRILHGNESPVCGPLAEGLLCCLQSAALPVQTPSAGESADAACSV